MSQQDILHHRINNQLLGEHTFTTPEQVVEHLLCMQWQDLKQVKWAIASRLWKWISLSDIEQAFNDWKIVRTRTQRWTIHVVCAKDAAWMVQLCASKTLKSFERRKKNLGIDNHQYADALRYLEEYLGTWPKIRKDISSHLSKLWITMQSGMLYNILCFAGSSWMIVQWPIIDGEHAFALTKEWCKDAIILDEQEALKECTYRYFISHWPATIEDFMRWSGLNKTQIKQGIELCWDKLQKNMVDGKEYRWHVGTHGNASLFCELLYKDALPCVPTYDDNSKVHLMAWFDEFLLWYKERTATLHLDQHTLVDPARNWIFRPTVMVNGKTVATRNIKSTKKLHMVNIKQFEALNTYAVAQLEKEVGKYVQYLENTIPFTIEFQ